MSTDLSAIFKGTNREARRDEMPKLDVDWLYSSFMIGNDDMLTKDDVINRFKSTAATKVADGTLGGNIYMNPKPQYTRYCDIRAHDMLSGSLAVPSFARKQVTVVSKGNHGMGRYWSEAHDDNEELIFLQFGIPRFNSLITFFTHAIDYVDSVVANTGRSPLGYRAGQVVGYVGMLLAFPALTMTISAVKFMLSLTTMTSDVFKYYYMQEEMFMYWGTVNTIVTMLATELGILIPIVKRTILPNEYIDDDGNQRSNMKKIGTNVTLDTADMKYLSELMPGIISDSGYLDVFAMVTKQQRMANAQLVYQRELFENNASVAASTNGYISSAGLNKVNDLYGINTARNPTAAADNYNAIGWWNKRFTFQQYIDTLLGVGKQVQDYRMPMMTDRAAKAPPTGSNSTVVDKTVYETASNSTIATDAESTGDDNITIAGRKVVDDTTAAVANGSLNPYGLNQKDEDTHAVQTTDTLMGKMLNKVSEAAGAFDSSLRMGGAFAVLAVDYSGPSSESFSNQTSDIQTAGLLKQVGGTARNLKFDLAGGEFLGDTIGKVVGYAKDIGFGILDSISFGLSNVLQTLLGGGYIDLPKKWDDSDMQINSTSYTMTLISPYNNPISQLQFIYIPLAMLLAGTLPLATGKASYTSPYLCSVFNRGKQKINMGMITSLSITRGVSNTGFSDNKQALAIDVSFTITDFSSMMAAPINTSIFGAFNVSLDDDNPFGNYMQVLGSRDILSSKFLLRKLSIAVSRAVFGLQQTVSGSGFGLRVGEKLEGGFGLFANDTVLTNSQS